MPGDIVDPATGSRMMAGIRGKNTRPELLVRHGLHALGFRFRLHDRSLPGSPDIILSRWRAVIFVHGCFWHGHDCHLFKWPATRDEFWRQKISRNRELDRRAADALRETAWRHAAVWECALKGKTRLPLSDVIEQLAAWLKEGGDSLEIAGKDRGEQGGSAI